MGSELFLLVSVEASVVAPSYRFFSFIVPYASVGQEEVELLAATSATGIVPMSHKSTPWPPQKPAEDFPRPSREPPDLTPSAPASAAKPSGCFAQLHIEVLQRASVWGSGFGVVQRFPTRLSAVESELRNAEWSKGVSHVRRSAPVRHSCGFYPGNSSS